MTRFLKLVNLSPRGIRHSVSRLEPLTCSRQPGLRWTDIVEYVVAALLRLTIRCTRTRHMHCAFAAQPIAPYVSERVAWIVSPPEFQHYYYAPHMCVVR